MACLAHVPHDRGQRTRGALENWPPGRKCARQRPNVPMSVQTDPRNRCWTCVWGVPLSAQAAAARRRPGPSSGREFAEVSARPPTGAHASGMCFALRCSRCPGLRKLHTRADPAPATPLRRLPSELGVARPSSMLHCTEFIPQASPSLQRLVDLGHSRQHVGKCRPKLAGVGQMLGNLGNNWKTPTKLGQHLADVGQSWPTLGNSRPELADVGSNSTQIDQSVPKIGSVGRPLPKLPQLGQTLARHRPMVVEHWKHWPKCGPHRPTVGPARLT